MFTKTLLWHLALNFSNFSPKILHMLKIVGDAFANLEESFATVLQVFGEIQSQTICK